MEALPLTQIGCTSVDTSKFYTSVVITAFAFSGTAGLVDYTLSVTPTQRLYYKVCNS